MSEILITIAEVIELKANAVQTPVVMETVRTSSGLCHKVGPLPWKREKENHACIYDDYPGERGGTAVLVGTAKLFAAADRIASLAIALDARVKELEARPLGIFDSALVAWQDARIKALEHLCGATYQAIGAAEGPTAMLDNLSAAASSLPLPHDPGEGLPWIPDRTEKLLELESRQAVPEGWKVVPVEATREMLDAYVSLEGKFHSGRSDWSAMLSAAPSPPDEVK